MPLECHGATWLVLVSMTTMPPMLDRRSPDVRPDTPSSPLRLSKPRRVLACVLCQQRKVKCDRKFPCANCMKSNTQCIPARLTQPQRRRRFPERELLERLRRYEDLLRQNGIAYEPLHKDSVPRDEPFNVQSGAGPDDEHPRTSDLGSSSLSTHSNSEKGHEAKYALSNQLFQDD